MQQSADSLLLDSVERMASHVVNTNFSFLVYRRRLRITMRDRKLTRDHLVFNIPSTTKRTSEYIRVYTISDRNASACSCGRKWETSCLIYYVISTRRSSQFQDLYDGCARLVRSIVLPPICRLFSFLLLSYLQSIIFISVTLSLSTRREIQAVPLLLPPPSPSPSPSSSAQPISVTMGWFPERSGVDAKLSEGSLFDLLLPIYKHENANGKKRACVRACVCM